MRRGLKAEPIPGARPEKACRRIFPDEEGTESGYCYATRASVTSRRIFPDEEGTERGKQDRLIFYSLGSQNLPR